MLNKILNRLGLVIISKDDLESLKHDRTRAITLSTAIKETMPAHIECTIIKRAFEIMEGIKNGRNIVSLRRQATR